jgi:hypothetical protein
MGRVTGLGLGSGGVPFFAVGRTEHIIVQRPLRRVLAAIGRTIDDVVNDPMVKREVLGFYKLHKWVDRRCEVVELERQWNRVGGA